MGHAHHFLSRLDRVTNAHVELALSLYNDVPLLKHILGRTRLPERAERVALSLDHPDDGPFLVVTREGRFVTCLGAGMRVDHSDLPVVPRSQLDVLATQGTVLRERMRAAEQYTSGDGAGVQALLNRINTAGGELAREEFVALTGLEPLLGDRWRSELISVVSQIEEARPQLLEINDALDSRLPDTLAAISDRLLRKLWQNVWAVGHLCLLAALDGPRIFDAYDTDVRGPLARLFAEGPAAQGLVALTLRGAWAVGRLGKPVLAAQKEAYRTATRIHEMVASCAGLATLGVRHSKLRAEIQKFFEAQDRAGVSAREAVLADPASWMTSQLPDGTAAEQVAAATAQLETAARGYRGAAAQFAAGVLGEPDAWRATHLDIGRRLAVKLTAHRAESSGMRFARAEDVPDEVAFTTVLNDRGNVIANPESLGTVLMCVPYLAQVDAELFYFTRAQLPAARMHYRPDVTRQLLAALRLEHPEPAVQRPAPRRVESVPGRNEPCHCGSGKKYKRCHGA